MTASRHQFIRLLGGALIALALLAAGASALIATGNTTAATTVPTIPGAVTTTPTVVVPTTAGGVLTATPAANATVTLTPGVTNGALNVVRTPGATVFLGENGLDITATGVAAGDTLGWFQAGADVATSSPDDTLIVSNPASFYVQPGTRTGAWYDMTRNRAVAINVKDPSLNVRVWGLPANQDVTGKTITKGQLLTFRVDSNVDAAFTQRGVGAPVTVKVQDPSGNVYSALIDDLGNQNSIVNIPVTASSMLVPGKGANGSVWDTANANYRSGDYKVWAECNMNGMKDNYKDPSGADYTGKTISSQYTITIGTNTLTLTANTNATVVRNTDFAVSIAGQPNTAYALWVSGTSSLSGTAEPPRIKEGQAGVTLGDATAGGLIFSGTRTVADDVPAAANTTTANPWYARVVTDDNGRRTVGFSTNQQTKDQSYTIRAQTIDTTAASKFDTVDLSIAKGGVTVSTAANQSFYLGEEVRLTGTNTDSETTYLFITGPNLPSGGANLVDVSPVVSGDAGTFTTTTVNADNTWEYRWATANLNLDAGSYTIYAVSSPNNRDNLGSTQYSTTSLVVRRPFVTANASAATVAKGDILAITGTAEGKPAPGVAIWIFGTNYYSRTTQSVNDDTTFRYELGHGTTQNLASGQYFAVVQHPMTNGVFDVDEVVDGGITRVYDTSGNFFIAAGPGRLQGSDAANALVNLINGANIDDTYTKLTFAVQEASIQLTIPDVRPGAQLRISGTTNLAIGDNLLITVVSSAFEPTNKSAASGFSGLSGQTTVQAGSGGQNTFNFTADTSQLQLDTYQVTVEAPDAGASQTGTFRVTNEAGGNVTATATPVGNVTGTFATPTGAATGTVAPTVTGNATATPTPALGFGTLVALAGLAGVALLVVRRRE
ncbi:MAG: MEMAR_RS02690 family S-layer glycoprotein [Methanospirillum sp.]